MTSTMIPMSAPIDKTFTTEQQNDILENGCVQFGTIKENKTKTVGWEKEQTPLEGLETLDTLENENHISININPEDENGNENIYGVWNARHHAYLVNVIHVGCDKEKWLPNRRAFRISMAEKKVDKEAQVACVQNISDIPVPSFRNIEHLDIEHQEGPSHVTVDNLDNLEMVQTEEETEARAAAQVAPQEEEVAPPKEKKKRAPRAPREPKVGSRAYKKLMPRCEFINPKSGCQCRCKCENMADTLCKKHAIVKIQCDPANWKRLLGDINEIITEILQNAFNQDASENEELHDLIRQNLDIKGINEDVDAYLDTMTKMCARKYIRSRYTYLKNKNVECDGIRLDGNACQEQCEQGWVNLVKKMKKMVSQD